MLVLHYAAFGQRITQCLKANVACSTIRRYTSTKRLPSDPENSAFSESSIQDSDSEPFFEFSDLVKQSAVASFTHPRLFASWNEDFWNRHNVISAKLQFLKVPQRAKAPQAPPIRPKVEATHLESEAAYDSQDVFGDLLSAIESNDQQPDANDSHAFSTALSSQAKSEWPQNANDRLSGSSTSIKRHLKAPSFDDWFKSRAANDYLLSTSQRTAYQMRLCEDYRRLAKSIPRPEKTSIARSKHLEDHFKGILAQNDAYASTMRRSELSQLKQLIDFLLINVHSDASLSTRELCFFIPTHHELSIRRAPVSHHDRKIFAHFSAFKVALQDYVNCISDLNSRGSSKARCQELIGYEFKDPRLLEQSLGIVGNESSASYTIRQLAILGDAELRSALARKYFSTNMVFSDLPFQRIFEDIGTNEALTQTYNRYGLAQSSLKRTISTESGATALEALLGAVSIDGGKAALEVVMRNLGMLDVFEKQVQRCESSPIRMHETDHQLVSADGEDFDGRDGTFTSNIDSTIVADPLQPDGSSVINAVDTEDNFMPYRESTLVTDVANMAEHHLQSSESRNLGLDLTNVKELHCEEGDEVSYPHSSKLPLSIKYVPGKNIPDFSYNEQLAALKSVKKRIFNARKSNARRRGANSKANDRRLAQMLSSLYLRVANLKRRQVLKLPINHDSALAFNRKMDDLQRLQGL